MKILNAIIKNVDIKKDMNMLFVNLYLDFGNYGRTVSYLAYQPKFASKANAGQFLYELFKVLDIENFSELRNKPIRVVENEKNGIIHEIGNIIEDKWITIVQEESHGT